MRGGGYFLIGQICKGYVVDEGEGDDGDGRGRFGFRGRSGIALGDCGGVRRGRIGAQVYDDKALAVEYGEEGAAEAQEACGTFPEGGEGAGVLGVGHQYE